MSKITNKFADMFIMEAVATIEVLTGQAPSIVLKEIEYISTISNVIPPICAIDLAFTRYFGNFSSSQSGRGIVMMPPQLATALGDMMLGGEGEGQDTMSDEDMDAAKEIVSNIVGAMSTTLASQKELPKFTIKPERAEFIPESGEVNLDGYAKMFVFTFSLGSINSLMMLAIDSNVNDLLTSVFHRDISDTSEVNDTCKRYSGESTPYSLINDVKVEVSVLVGSKSVSLEYFKTLATGSVIETEQLANEPLTIMVNNVPYAEGEVVVVDGNYGVQITKLLTKEDVYHV